MFATTLYWHHLQTNSLPQFRDIFPVAIKNKIRDQNTSKRQTRKQTTIDTRKVLEYF